MKSNKRIILAAAALLASTALATLAPSSAFAADPAQATAQQAASTLEKLTPENVRENMGGDKPVFVIVTGANCATCPALVSALAGEAAKHDGLKILEANGADFGVPDSVLPLVITNVPGVGQTFAQENFAAPADMGAFVAQRVDLATKTAAAARAVSDVEAKIETATEPFAAERADLAKRANAALQPLKDEAATVAKPFQDQIAEVTQRREAAIASFVVELNNAKNEAEYTAAVQKIRDASKPFADEVAGIKTKLAEAIKPIQKRADVLLKPFKDEAAKIEERKTAALAPLNEELSKAEEALQALVAQDVPATQSK